MRIGRSLASAAVFLFVCAAVLAQGVRAVPELRARVTDDTGTLGAATVRALEARLTSLENETGSQVAVLVVDTTAPESIEQFALRVAESWRLGRQGIDDGVLLLVAMNDRAMRIETGYGVEGALPDARANRIIDEIITPRFRDGDYAGGISAGLDAIAAAIRGEDLPAPAARSRDGGGLDIGGFLPILLIIGMTVGGVLKRAFGSLPGAALAGGVVGTIVWFIAGVLATAVIAGLIAFFVILFAASGPGSWSSGRGYGGGFRGGGGGFSGGGGSFGGGGASGRW